MCVCLIIVSYIFLCYSRSNHCSVNKHQRELQIRKKKMNSLQEGRYTLSTMGECNKSLIFVKLTDSAMQSIEMYLNSKADSSLKPTIHFQENSGVISLPMSGRKQNYGFTLSDIKADGLQSSFQCLQHIDNGSLESLGIMLKRIHIHANEDSYEKTKVKMEAVEKEQKSLCTKEIKSNRTLLGVKCKMKRPGLAVPPNKFSSIIKKPEPAKFDLKNKVVNSSILQQPIRKRIIHILAIKPYKKPEVLLRLKIEGITDKDKKEFETVLNNVGTLKEDVYYLANHLWNEVEENWEFCSKGELQIIQRRKHQILKRGNENETSSSASQHISTLQKNTSSEPVAACFPSNKKRRISHNSPIITNPVVKDNSVKCDNSAKCDNSSKSEFSSVNNSQKLPDSQVSGKSYIAGQRHKSAELCFGKKILSSQKLQNSGDQIGSYKNIFEPGPDLSSKKQTVSDFNFKTDVSKQRRNVQQEDIVNNSLNNLQNGTLSPLSLPLTNSYSFSNIQAKKLVNSQSEEKDHRRYESSNVNGLVNNNTSGANGISIIDMSKIISPVSSSNSSDSNLCNKDENNVLH